MSRWFRLYDDLVDDPKVQRLPSDTFKGLVNIWCLASKAGGVLPSIDEIAFKLRMSEDKTVRLIHALHNAGLIDADGDTLRPHNWDGRQFKSDNVSERVKKHREKQRHPVSETLHVTPPEAETEAEQSRAEQRGQEPRPREKLDAVETACREAAGMENSPHPGFFDLSPILTLIDKGYDLDRDILPILKAKREAGKRARSWGWFVAAIEDRHESNAAIAEKPGSKVVAPPPDRQVFVKVGTPEWAEWQRVKPTKFVKSAEHDAEGWWFPAQRPAPEMRAQ